MDVDAELERLTDSAASLERQAGELRVAVDQLAGAVRERAAVPSPVETAVEPQPADDSDARLVAYSMVLDGKPRDEVADRLREEFGIEDSAALLDDVYARAS